MSRLKELIAQLDPNGLNRLPIGKLITRVKERGKDATDVIQVYAVSNTLGIVKAEDYRENTIHSEDTTNYTVVREGMVAYNPSRLNIGSIAMLKTKTPGLVSPMYVVFSIDETLITREYFEYLIHSSYVASKINSFKEEGARFRFDFSRWNWILISVPPIPVQKEIVNILDTFSELSTKLKAELTARKTQLSYYREQLIKSSSDTEVKLSKVVDIYLGLTATPNYVESGVKFISAQNISSDYLDLDNVKFISNEDFKKATNNAKPKKGDLLFTRVGSNLGHPIIVDTDEELCIFVSLGFLRIKNKNEIVVDYLKHWMNTDLFWNQVKKNVHGAAKVNLNTGWLKDFLIPLPSYENQQKIVSELNSLEELCTSKTSGLPAEIEERNKQFAYYRDLLMTFEERFS